MAHDTYQFIDEELLRWFRKKHVRQIEVQQGWGTAVAPIEIRSGAVIPYIGLPGAFLIQANTAQGLLMFGPTIETKFDAQSEPGFDPAKMPPTTVTINWVQPPPPRKLGSSVQRHGAEQPTIAGEFPQAGLSPDEILSRLKDPTLADAELRRVVIEIEVVPLSGPEKSEVLPLLRNFIERRRDSQSHDDLVAVGAAIRKLVANIDAAEIGTVALLLEPGHQASVPLEVELELTKSIVRKLAAAPPRRRESTTASRGWRTT
ncbi:MAG TPA: hypothetical protein VMV69_07645 [Pirellulales bacterium]|nr:hypothetical protein [Pirellulales bacterium]